jgi:hypothetical protein
MILRPMPRFLARKNRARFSPFALLLVPCAAVSCGGAPPAPQAPASSATAVASVPLPVAPDVGPVPPPQGLVVSGSVPKLGSSFTTVHGWTQLPMPQSEQVTEIIASEGLGPLVDVDRPIDFAVAVTGSGPRLNPLFAVAAGVRDLDAAKAALAEHHKLVPGDNGALLIKGVGGHASGGDGPPGQGADDSNGDSGDDDRICELAPAYGASSTRLVCAEDAKSLAALGPWLTRGATRENPGSDLHVDFRMDPLKPTIVEERRLFSVMLGAMAGGRVGLTGARELASAFGADMADFGTDLDTATLEVALSDPGGAATLTMRLGGTASVLGRILTSNADRNGPPPDTFWQMPADADFAAYSRGVDPSLIAHGRELVLKALADKLAEDGVKDADRHAIVDALNGIVTSAPTVYAGGVDLEAVRKALAVEKALPEAAEMPERREAIRMASQALLGWRVVESDEPPGPRMDAVKAVVAAWPRAVGAYRAKGARVVAVRAAPLPKGSKLPKGTLHYALDIPLPDPVVFVAPNSKAKPAGAGRPLTVDVFVVPDGTRTWIGVGGDPALSSAKLEAAMSGAGDNLRGRAELAGFKDPASGSGGFVTTRGMIEAVLQVAELSGDPSGFGLSDSLFDGIGQLPHQGMTPIAFTVTAPATTPGTAVTTLQIPRGTVDDFMMMLIKHGF